MSIDWESQRQRINRDYTLKEGTGVIPVPSASGIQNTICLPIEMINGFLFGIDDSRIKDPLVQANIRKYKRECYKVSYNHFHPKQVEKSNDQLNGEFLCKM